MKEPKIVALHLPQFHQIPENDSWWGEGFTEWTRVKAAFPLFPEHAQPRVPLDQKYYDMSHHKVMCDQAELARKYGIDAFCFYHYWFQGKRLLEKPLEALLNHSEPDFPYMLAWANEPWTRAWNEGSAHEVLMPQGYGDAVDWQAHFNCLIRFFKDERYVKIGNKPVLMIFRPESIPCLDAMIPYWNSELKKVGFDGIHLVRMLTIYSDLSWNSPHFAASTESEPSFSMGVTLPQRYLILRKLRRLGMKLTGKLFLPMKYRRRFIQSYSYDHLVSHIVHRSPPVKGTLYPGVFVDWDNTPRRREHGVVVHGGSAEKFGQFLKKQYEKARQSQSDFVLINAWNEWAEGAYLEPDTQNAYAYLEQVVSLRTKD